MKAKQILLIALAMISISFCGCEKKAEVLPAADVTDLQYTAVERTVTLTWTLPQNEQVIAVQIVQDGVTFWEEQGAATQAVVENVPVGEDVEFTVRAITPTSISKGVSITVNISAGKMAIPAMLLLAPDPEALPDDDEQAAALWFKANFVDKNTGVFIDAAQLKTLSKKDYSTVFIMVDRVGIGYGWDKLPAALVSQDALNGMKNYLAEGGTIFFAKMATQLISAIGRIEGAYDPGIFGDGDGGTGDDTWCINANIGGIYDHRSHPIFQMMDRNTTEYTHETFALLGPGGVREDHNCMWDCNSYGFSGDPNVVKNFEDATSSTVLATWGHVTDFCCAGIVEFLPTASFKGTVIANGLSAYEFKQNNQDNQYQANLERLTLNTINYLSKLGLQ